MLKFLFSPKGRIGRVPFAAFVIPPTMVFVGIGVFLAFNATFIDDQTYDLLLMSLVVLPVLFLWPSFALTIKRLHDINLSWPPALIWFWPFLAVASTFILRLLAGTEADAQIYTTIGERVTVLNRLLLFLELALVAVLSFIPGTKGLNRYDTNIPDERVFD